MHYDYDEERYILDVPTECPKCGSELELNNEYDSLQLFCVNNKCDYELDVTDEFRKLEEAEADEAECEDEE